MNQYNILNPGYGLEDTQFIKGKGSYLYSKNGDKYIDMSMGAGALILGHAPEKIITAVEKQLNKGTLFLQNNTIVQKLSEQISKRIPEYLKHHIYCNTGSEATQRAVRLARAASGKMHIASFQGGWHGMNEWTLLDDGGRFGDRIVKPYSGIPEVALDYSILLPYNDDSIWLKLEENANKLAAIIIEPIQGSNPQPQIYNYLEKLITVCNKLNIMVIFDEVITGFRFGKGGVAKAFKLTPDIVTYGKVLGGGLPIGLVAFNHQVHQKTFNNPDNKILTGGTFSANPLSAASALATLNELNESLYTDIDKLAKYFRKKLNELFKSNHIPFKADGIYSISRVYFTDHTIKNRQERDEYELPSHLQLKFRELLWEKNIIWPNNGIVCFSITHNIRLIDTVITEIITAAKQVLKEQNEKSTF